MDRPMTPPFRASSGMSPRTIARAWLVLVCGLVLPGCSDPSSPEFLNPHDGSSPLYTPAAPSSLTLSESSERVRTLTWHRNSSAEQGFSIERRSGLATPYEVIGRLPAGTVSFRDTSIIRTDTPYAYRIVAHAANGHSSAYDSINFELRFPVPGGLHVNFSSRDTVQLAWSDTAQFAEGYIVERRTRGTDFVQIAVLPARMSSWTESPPDTSEDFSYRIHGYTSLNTGRPSNTAGVVFTPSVGPPVVRASGGSGVITHIVSNDGSLMLTIGVSEWYAVYDEVRGVHLWGRDQRDMGTAGFSGDNSIFAFNTNDGKLHVVRMADGQEVQTIAASASLDYGERIALNHDGSALAYREASRIVVYDTRTGSVLLKTPEHSGWINYLDFSPEGSLLACATGTGIELWDFRIGALSAILPCTGEQYYVRFGLHGRLASMGKDGSLSFWDTSSRTLLASARSYWLEMACGGFDPEGLRFVTEYQENNLSPVRIGIWRVSDGVLLQSLPLAGGEASAPWIGITDRYSGLNAILTVDFSAKVQERILSYAWRPRDW